MPIQFRTLQYADDSVTADKVDLANGTYAFTQGATVQVSTPSAANDAANKAYVDAALQGAYWKDAVRAATVASGTLASDFENGDAIDGVTLATGDRILIKDQSTASENGIYIVQASGTPVRAGDMNADAEFPSAAVFVQEGSANADLGYICTVDENFTIGDDVNFTQFTGLGQIEAGAGLSKSGNTIDVELSSNKGLAFSGAGASGTLEVIIDTAKGIGFSGSGELQTKIDVAKGLEYDGTSGEIAVKLKANRGLDFESGTGLLEAKLQDALAFEASGEISVQFADGLDLTAGNALEVQVDSTTIEINASNNLQVVDNSLGLDKQAWRPAYEEFTGVSGTTIAVANAVDSDFLEAVCVFRNGQRLQANPSPSNAGEYSVAASGLITFGGALSMGTGEVIQVDYIH